MRKPLWESPELGNKESDGGPGYGLENLALAEPVAVPGLVPDLLQWVVVHERPERPVGHTCVESDFTFFNKRMNCTATGYFI